MITFLDLIVSSTHSRFSVGQKVFSIVSISAFLSRFDVVKLTPTNNEPNENCVKQIFVSGARFVIV